MFSFTPRKRVLTEAAEMARAAGGRLTYYEDTNSIIDDLKSSPEGSKILAVHVLTPEFAHLTSHHADRVVGQLQYQQEVLL